jgi:phosphoglucosamine mutase
MSKNKKIFGTDGVRGTANVEPVTAETALKLGRSAAHVFKNLEATPRDQGKHRIVIGKDTRLSGYMLENAISSGILSMGVDVLFIGPLPTPGVAYATRSLRADAGIVITASHNPYDDNGIKFFGPDGHKLADNIENMVEELVFSGEIENVRPRAGAIGKAVRIEDALGRYIEFAKASFPRRMTLDGMRIVVDCANGATYKSTPCVLRELGAEIFVYGHEPDGTNINKECGSMYPGHLADKVKEYRADLGIAHDGDGDRVVLCDEHGTILDGDDIMAICGLDMLANGTLGNKTLVTTIMSNAGLDVAIKQAGGKIIRTDVGDKNVIDAMLKKEINLGGEESGHLIFGDHASTGDGLVAALQVLATMKEKDAKLSDLRKCWTRFPRKVANIRVKEKPPFEKLDGIVELVKSAEKDLKPSGGRVLLRYSGTEPKVRLLIESSDKKLIDKWAKKITEAMQAQIGA